MAYWISRHPAHQAGLGIRVIDLTVTVNGSRSVLNIADWVAAGFVLKKEAKSKTLGEPLVW